MTQLPAPALHRAALEAAARGWHVFPLRPDDKRPSGHAEDRCPRTGHCTRGHLKPEQRATLDLELIRQCWSHRPYGIGIATGPSGLVVIDLDVPKDSSKNDAPDGAATFQALCERTGQSVPTTYTVRTRRGGQHLYFTAPRGVRLHNSQDKLGPGIDTRAWGGYVVAPGSTVGGKPYRVENDVPPRELPTWLTTLLAPAPRRSTTVRTPLVGNAGTYAATALRNEEHAVANAPEGKRNAALMRAARALGRFVAVGDLDRVVVEEALNGAGVAAGLTERESAATVTSALNWSIARNGQRRAG